jgi:predicted  nucleic acid-binding Zn-ribbon protein
MPKQISVERKIMIIERMISGDSQSQVARDFKISTGEASNIWNEFKRGEIIDKESGILSENLRDIARIARDNNITPSEFSNAYLLGKMLQDTGINPNLLSQISARLKPLGENERNAVLNGILEIERIKKEGETIDEAEERVMSEMRQAGEAEKRKAELKQAIERLEEERKSKRADIATEISSLKDERDKLNEEIALGDAISKETGIVDRANIIGLIEAASGAGNKDDLIRLTKISKISREKGMKAEDLISGTEVIRKAEGKGFSISVIDDIQKQCENGNITFRQYLEQLIPFIRDRERYEGEIERKMEESNELTRKIDTLKVDHVKLEKKLGDLNRTLDDKGNELNRLNGEIEGLKATISHENDKLKRIESSLTSKRNELYNVFRDIDYTKRGIGSVKEMEYHISKLEQDRGKLMRESISLGLQISSKRELIDRSEAFNNLIRYGNASDRKKLKGLLEEMLNEIKINGSQLPTDEVRDSAFNLLINLADREIPMIIDYNSRKMKILSRSEYDDLIKKGEELKVALEENRNLNQKNESFKNGIAQYIHEQLRNEQLRNANPDQFVLQSIHEAAIFYLNRRNSSEELGKRIDWIIMNGLNIAKAYRRRNDLDGFLDVKVIEFGNKNALDFREKASTLFTAMARGVNINVGGHSISPCMLLEGYLAGGLFIDNGKFQRVDKFIKMGKRIGNQGMFNV